MYFRNRHHRGLATLEMVLVLPLLLMIMALMINYGTEASWKIRVLGMSRQAVFGTRWPRSGMSDPRPAYWPTNGAAGASAAGKLPALDVPAVNQPVARGPLFGAQVNADLLDPSRGLRLGNAELTRGYPMVAKMGNYTVRAGTYLLDDKWQYQRMGLGSTTQRRIPVIYALQKAPASALNAYVQAVMAIYRVPFRANLYPLDNDDEFKMYGAMFGWGSSSPDFHPRLANFCTLDRDVADQAAQNLIDRIQGVNEQNRHVNSVAETMANAFISLYQRVINAINSSNPPLPNGPAMIQQLQDKIKVLQDYLQTLQ